MGKESTKCKIIYVAGYGRSGSTLIDIVLSNSSNITTVGEISNIFNELSDITNLKYSFYLNETLNDLNLKGKDIQSLKNADNIFGVYNSIYSDFWSLFFNKIKHDENIEFIIDSSKTTWKTLFRPYNLIKSGFEINIVFLKAPYSKVWKSALKGSNKTLDSSPNKNLNNHYIFAIKSIFSKFLIDFLTKIIYSRRKYKLVKVDYFDFINETENIIKKLSVAFELNFKNLNNKIRKNEFLISGGYMGNRLRKENHTLKIKKTVYD
ncbi:hypothetical protein [Croceibacter atlanticus]|jgi:hypothetical protein|uniref:hypothetical protein n=1 Tax=Croceibacter atlanticus TaxID=313588 RepID=UPI0030FCE3B0